MCVIKFTDLSHFSSRCTGPVVNRSARMTSLAKGGQIIVSSVVYDRVAGALLADNSALVLDMGDVELRGLSDRTHIVQILPRALAERTETFVSVLVQVCVCVCVCVCVQLLYCCCCCCCCCCWLDAI